MQAISPAERKLKWGKKPKSNINHVGRKRDGQKTSRQEDFERKHSGFPQPDVNPRKPVHGKQAEVLLAPWNTTTPHEQHEMFVNLHKLSGSNPVSTKASLTNKDELVPETGQSKFCSKRSPLARVSTYRWPKTFQETQHGVQPDQDVGGYFRIRGIPLSRLC